MRQSLKVHDQSFVICPTFSMFTLDFQHTYLGCTSKLSAIMLEAEKESMQKHYYVIKNVYYFDTIMLR